MKICDFNCSDVIIKKYSQKSISKKASIKLVLISEALPQKIDDYFDGNGEPTFIRNTNIIFNSFGYNYKTYEDYLNNGIYLTTAIKCIKKEYLVSSETIKNCSIVLERELDEFPNKKVIMLMGDFAIKAMNYIWKRKYNTKVIPVGSTYKIRNGIYESNGIRFFPLYTQTGDSFGLEKSKVEMIIDGHAHACGYYHNAQSAIHYLNEHQIGKVLLCPGEPNSLKNYKLPMFSNIIHSPNLGYIFNRLISFIVGIKGVAKHIDEQNTIIGNMAKQYPNEIIQAYWVNPLDKDYIVKLEKDFEIFNFRIVKLHQCWNKFDVLSEDFIKIIQWATNKKLPIFIHLFSKEQSIRFAKLTNEFINTTFIIAHMIGFEEITAKSINTNVYFDISAPQLISKKRIENAIKIVGSNRLILGSDAPYGIDNIKINLDLLNTLSISEQEKQNIIGNNIAGLLNLS